LDARRNSPINLDIEGDMLTAFFAQPSEAIQ
jgi:hypothetical protein